MIRIRVHLHLHQYIQNQPNQASHHQRTYVLGRRRFSGYWLIGDSHSTYTYGSTVPFGIDTPQFLLAFVYGMLIPVWNVFLIV